MKYIKKYWFAAVAAAACILLCIILPRDGVEALRFTGGHILDFLFILTPVFILTGLMDVWVERETMIGLMGESSGIKGRGIALLAGVITAVPLYALFPIAGMMLKKGGTISNVLIFICASAGIRIPLLLFEASSLGWRFTLAWLAVNILPVFAMAILIEKMLSKADRQAIYENAENL